MWVTRFIPLLLLVTSPAFAVSKAELENRIQLLEKKLNRVVLEQLDEVNGLRQEIQQLRGDIEVQSHEVQTLQKKQRDLYLDIDRRLTALESGRQPTAGYGSRQEDGGYSAGNTGSSAPAGGASAVDDASARQEYDKALDILKQGRYEQALAAFKQFLQRYPNSSYTDNAQYWIGEVYYVTRKFPLALQEFDRVIKRFPDSPKVADARLKSGFINYELKQWSAARTALEQVRDNYPGSTPARLAEERLQRMSKEGH